MPVALKWPSTAPPSPTPWRSNTKMSCMVMTSPSMPVISEMLVTLRVPSPSRLTWITTWMALAICWRIAFSGRSRLAMAIMVSSRLSASRGVLAWSVVSEPSWPVFMACSMSTASAPRHSPMMMRSGRMRSALTSSTRCGTSPVPSMLAGRVSSRTTCGWRSWSSAESSMVTMRSLAGMNEDRTLSSVVLPAPVPPEIRMLSRALTTAVQQLEHRLRERSRTAAGPRR